MDNCQLTSVSHCGNYMACVTADGQVHFWDTSSSNLLSRFSFHRHSNNLSLVCVNIKWLHNSNTVIQEEISEDEPPKKKTKKDETIHPTRTEKLAAIGTSDGTIWVYNFIKQKLHTQFKGISGRGTLLNFDYEPIRRCFFMLYSKSYVSQANFSGNEIKSFELDKNDYKFVKDDSKPIIYVVNQNKILVGKNILAMIDWQNLVIINNFSGNNSKITVCEVCSPLNRSNRSFLFLGTESDRTITVYDVNNSAEQYAFLTLDDSPTSLQVHITEDVRLLAFVITASGKLFVFQEDIHEIKKKNKDRIFKPKWVLSVSVEPKIDFGFVRWIQDFDVKEGGFSGSVVYGYGSGLNPNFETIVMKKMRKVYLDQSGIIKGKKPTKEDKETKNAKEIKESKNNEKKGAKSKEDKPLKEEKKMIIVQENVQKSKFESTKSNNKSVQILGPALQNCNPLAAFEEEPKIRKEPKSPKQMTLEMRLKLEELGMKNFLKDQEEEQEKEERKKIRKKMHGVSDKMVTALEQGLQSDNTKTLMTALLCPDRKTIQNTVSAMKFQTIVPLLNKLQVLVHSSDGNQEIYYNWLSIITKKKLSYLLQLPEKDKLFIPIFKLLDFKQDSFHKLSLLHARLQLMMDTMRELNKPVKEALIRYETDSSDDEKSYPNDDDRDFEVEDKDGDSNESDDQDMENGEVSENEFMSE